MSIIREEIIGNARLLLGDCLKGLKQMESASIHTCVTSPPYWGLRDYGVSGQMGLEQTPEEYVENIVNVFREVKRVLRDDGTVWLNLGDTYNAGRSGGHGATGGADKSTLASAAPTDATPIKKGRCPNLGAKQLIGIPWRVAFALQADGWYLRCDIIWSKPNPMPESVTDRPTKAHEYIFLLSKSPKYYYDHEAIAEPVTQSTTEKLSQSNLENQLGSDRVPGKTNGPMKAVGSADKRNKRSVWNVTTKPFKDAHFATFPPELIEPCILAGCPEGGVVLDMFAGSGTTGEVACIHRKKVVLIELNPDYFQMMKTRVENA